MSLQKLFFLLVLMVCIHACKKDPSKYTGEKIAFIKKEVVHTVGGNEINIGGDSIAKIYYLIRHAEELKNEENPLLSDEGQKRKVKLNNIFRYTFLDAIYATFTNRALQTVDSVAQYKGMPYFIYTDANIKEKLSEIDKSPTTNKVLIVGHSNTIPPIANHILANKHFNDIFKEDAYDNLLIIVEKKNKTREIYEFKY